MRWADRFLAAVAALWRTTAKTNAFSRGCAVLAGGPEFGLQGIFANFPVLAAIKTAYVDRKRQQPETKLFAVAISNPVGW